ncbi:MAG: HAMP domain-containing histidine kinase [Lachnospiraceae bacterium]|nr:HAMP domain-containing histidine kinase [Lachnospiraceae bacterium]
MKKRKTFLKVFSEKILISIPIILIIIIITFTALNQYSKYKVSEVMNYYSKPFITKLLQDKKEVPLEENFNFYKFRVVLNYESLLSQFPGLKSYIYVTDSDGNMIMDSSPAWSFLHTVRDENNELMERNVYLCDYETLSKFDIAKDVIDSYNTIYDKTLLEMFIPSKNTYRYIEILDGYVDPETLKMYPTTIVITTEKIPSWMGELKDDGDYVTDKEFVSRQLENTEGLLPYKYDMETGEFFLDGEKISGLHILLGRNMSLDDYQSIARRPFSNNLTDTANYTDPSGKEYVITTKITDDFLKTYLSIIIILSIIYILADIVVCFLLANLSYSKLKVWYQNEDYRKALMNSMAHDLKTPLTVMSGYAENLKLNVQSEKREHYADAIIENTEYMNGIIADVLALSKLESNNDPNSVAKTDFCEIAKEVIVRYEDALNQRGITYTIENSFSKNANTESVKRVLDNLINNAVKYTKDNGSIKIYSKGNSLIIQNTPITPLKTTPSKLWEPFVKDDESRSEKNGTGLGLSIVRSLLQSQGLKAKIISKGDDFRIVIK